jgi:hypothetical protein
MFSINSLAHAVAPARSGRRIDQSTRRASTACSIPAVHDGFREGAALGLTVAASTWLWIAVVDMIAGQPFYTFDLFGGIAVFTPIHCLLNVVYGVAIVSAVHGAARTPSLIYAVGFGLLFLEIVFAFATVALASFGLGDLAWVRIFSASLVGAAMALLLVGRRHSLVELLHVADQEH